MSSNNEISITQFIGNIIGAPLPSAPPEAPPGGGGDTIGTSNLEGGSYFYSAGNVLLAPPDRITIGLYARILATSKDQLERILEENHVLDTQLNKQYWAEVIANAQNLIDLKEGLNVLLDDELKLYDKQQREAIKYNEGARAEYNEYVDETIDPKIDEIQTTQQQFIDDMGEAQEHYDEVVADEDSTPADIQAAQDAIDDLREAYQGFVDNFNDNERGPLNTELDAKYQAYLDDLEILNAKIKANNDRIIELNAEREKLGISERIPLQLPDPIEPMPPPDPLPELADLPPDITEVTDFADYDSIPAEDPSPSISTDIVTPFLNSEEETFFATLKSDADDLNSGSILAYNDAINDTDEQVMIMRKAIDDFNNGLISPAVYNQIRTNYLQYAQDKNTELQGVIDDVRDDLDDYNDGIDAKNEQIEEFNEDREDGGKPLLPLQSEVDVPSEESLKLPTDIPEATSPAPPPIGENFPAIMPFVVQVSPAGAVTATDKENQIADHYKPLADAFEASFELNLEQMLLDQAYADFLNFYVQGYHILAPNGAYIKPVPNIFFNTETSSGSVSGVGMTTLSLGLDNTVLEGIIANGVLQAVRALFNIPIQTTFAQQILQFAVRSFLTSAIGSALPALSLLGDPQSIKAGGPGVAAALSLALVVQIRNLIDSGVLSDAIHAYLVASGLSEAEIAQVEGVITAGVTLGLLQLAVLQTAIALGLPGLIPQVLGNLYGIEDLSALVASLSGYGLNDVLDNTYLIGQLKKSLSDLGVTSDKIIQDSVNKVLAEGPFASDLDFKNALVREFKAAGVSDTKAIALAEAAVSFTRTERLIRDLDAQYVKSDILAAQTKLDSEILDIITRTADKKEYKTRREFRDELVKELIRKGYDREEAIDYADQLLIASQTETLRTAFESQRIDQEILRTSLKQELIKEGIAEADADAAVAAALAGVSANAYTSELLYREGLEEALRNAGIDDRVAARVGAGAAVVQTGTDELKTISVKVLNKPELAEKLTNDIAAELTDDVGAVEALNIANLFVAVLLGDEAGDANSVSNRLQSAVDYVKDKFGDKADEVLAEVFTEFIKPSFSLFDISARFIDPANALLLTAAWGPMYAGVDTDPKKHAGIYEIPGAQQI